MKKQKAKKLIIIQLIVLIAKYTTVIVTPVYLISLIYVYANQDAMIFASRPIDPAVTESLKTKQGIDEIQVRNDDDSVLNGWLVNAEANVKKPLVIYYGGNAEEVSHMIQIAQQNPKVVWALMNYRGYGNSTGKPSEKHLFADALTVYDKLKDRQDVDPKKITVFGRSLGGGVAVYVAQQRLVQKVLLVTPYDSVTNVAQEKYPYFPVGLLLNHRFDSLSRAKDIHVPVLIIAAADDKTIPPVHAAKLAAAIGSNASYQVVPDVGHLSISHSQVYINLVDSFLSN